MDEIERAWSANRAVAEREKVCRSCHRPIVTHTLAQARTCLSTIDAQESQAYCRLTGPVKR